MRVVALISGGKDSCFNMMHCVAMGHQIVALANLQPIINGEADSYMYQSVGHEAIQFYAKAMDLPLYRRKIQGHSKSTGLNYLQSKEDEVEDLFHLLKEIKDNVQYEGVSCGAILSDYQRIRVENVCNRLGLISLTYLWRRNQKELLQEMVDNQLESVLIKTAALGLNQKHLGKSLTQMQNHLIKLNEDYGSHICGEGGEYETFTLDCPLFKQKIIIDESEVIIHSDDLIAPVTYLYLKSCHLKEKTNYKQPKFSHLIPQFQLPKELCLKENLNKITPRNINWNIDKMESIQNKVNANKHKCFLFVSGICSTYNKQAKNQEIKQKTTELLNQLKDILEENNHGKENATYIHFYISNMNHFGIINSVYKTFFNINPPARVCVGLNGLKDDEIMMIECISCTNTTDHKVMHVQGISHWAPANIGPYSQCVLRCGLYFIAGQIGLDPGSMELKQSVEEQGCIALQHVESVLTAMDPELNLSNICQCVCYVTDIKYISTAKHIWQFKTTNSKECQKLDLVYVVVSSLPKNAKIEWQVVASETKTYSQQCITSCIDKDVLEPKEKLEEILKSLETNLSRNNQSFQNVIQLRLIYKQADLELETINELCKNLQENKNIPSISCVPVNCVVKHNSDEELCIAMLCLISNDL